jgi:hypothetical protein
MAAKETVGGILHDIATALGMSHLHGRIDTALPDDVPTDETKAAADAARREELQAELAKLQPAPDPSETTSVEGGA